MFGDQPVFVFLRVSVTFISFILFSYLPFTKGSSDMLFTVCFVVVYNCGLSIGVSVWQNGAMAIFLGVGLQRLTS